MSRKLIAVVALMLAVLLPVRGFAAHMLASCAMNGSPAAAHQMQTEAHNSSLQSLPPCHDRSDSSAQTTDDDMSPDNAACSARCIACAAACSTPALTPALLSLSIEVPRTSAPIANDSTFVNALLARADKPPVL